MKKSILLIAFFCVFFSHGLSANTHHKVQYQLRVQHKDFSIDKAIKHQIVHTMGTGMNARKAGYRSSLNYNYTYEIINSIKKENFTETFYKLDAEILIEKKVNLNNYKVIFPINPETIYKSAKRSKNFCTKRGYRSKKTFYWAWSPKLRRCGLKRNKDYIEVQAISHNQKVNNQTHYSSEFLINGKYEVFYYFGSDHFSLNRYGFASSAYNQVIKSFKKSNFKKIKNSQLKFSIFKKSKTLSKVTFLKGKINGAQANIYLMLGNPTDHTPKAKKEFFKFTKYALENGSSYNYSGHAGLGSVFNLDLLEEQYHEKINYNLNQKQMIYIDGCNTFFYSSNFFFKKKFLSNSLVLITNGLSILTAHYKQLVNTSASLLRRTNFNNQEILDLINGWMKRQRVDSVDMALVYPLSN